MTLPLSVIDGWVISSRSRWGNKSEITKGIRDFTFFSLQIADNSRFLFIASFMLLHTVFDNNFLLHFISLVFFFFFCALPFTRSLCSLLHHKRAYIPCEKFSTEINFSLKFLNGTFLWMIKNLIKWNQSRKWQGRQLTYIICNKNIWTWQRRSRRRAWKGREVS